MTSTFSSGKGRFEKPARGDDVDTWDTPIVANLDVTDACFSTTTSIAVTSGTTTMTQPQMRCQRVLVTGTLSGNVTVNFFAGVAGFFVCASIVTANGFSVTLGQNAGTTLSLPVGLHRAVFCDGTNVVAADAGSAPVGIPTGILGDFAMSTAPSGWLNCDGSAVSRTTFATLFATVGTVWGTGNGSTTFNVPNLNGKFRRTWDQSGSVDPARAFGSSQADAFASHNHPINDPQHSHPEIIASNFTILGGTSTFLTVASASSGTTGPASTGITIQNVGGSETRPINAAVLTCIKT